MSSIPGLDAATNAVSSISKAVDSLGPATGLSGILDSVGGFFKNLGGALTQLDVKLPLANPLHYYGSYSYVLALGCLSDEEANDPANTFMSGGRIDLICKSANADPNNRVQTVYGKFDFFIEDLEIDHQVGFEDDHNTNVTNLKFRVIEPYSMGMFLISLQQLAQTKGHDNWRDATWTLTINFRGNTETGLIKEIPKTFRCIPIQISDLDMTVTERGCEYKCEAFPSSQQALTDANAQFKNDMSISGASVQQLLQTGERSLQVALNRRAQLAADSKPGLVPDKYLILFPNDWTSGGASGAVTETDGGATVDTSSTSQEGLFKKLGVVQSTNANTEGNLVQNYDDCNVLGQAILQFDTKAPGDAPSGKENKVYDNATGTFFKGKLSTTDSGSDFKFSPSQDIPSAINEVLLKSVFVKNTFQSSNLSAEGYRKWWRIDPQVYNISSSENMDKTGVKPKLFVYRVIPYDVHASKLIAVNTKAPGFEALGEQCVKEYNYIYTGKNQDILDFKIYFENGFAVQMESDFLTKNADNVAATNQGEQKDPGTDGIDPLGNGNPPEKKLGVIPTIAKFIKKLTNTDKKGGGGPDSQATRAARLFHDAVTNNQSSMMSLDMNIMGDPYFIANSGMGNYTAGSTQYTNLHDDGSINYQNGEVHIKVNFRTPIDINQTTGLYSFSSVSNSAPVIAWTGIYQVTNISSKFSNGTFKQRLQGNRLPYQEATIEATAEQTYTVERPAKGTNTDEDEV